MFFRFGVCLVLLVIVTVFGTVIEKESLSLRRQISHQRYRMEALIDRRTQARAEAEQLGAPSRLLEFGREQQRSTGESVRNHRSLPQAAVGRSVTPAAPSHSPQKSRSSPVACDSTTSESTAPHSHDISSRDLPAHR
jgi:hypothetical protein